MSTEAPPVQRPPLRAAHVLLFILPTLCFAASVCVRPSGRLGPPDALPWIHQILYDDNDFAAYALRGLNDFLGRHAGRREAPEPSYPEDYAQSLRDSRTLSSEYYLEYPHAALLLFEVPHLFGPVSAEAPPSLLDGAHEDIVRHLPQGDQMGVWEYFHRAVTSYMLMMLAFHAGLVAILAAGYLPCGGLSYRGFLLILPGVLFFTLNRFDVVPAFLTALSLACLGRGRISASAVFLAVGTLIKVYPLFLAPLVVRYLLSVKTPRSAAGWVVAYGMTLAAFLVPAVLAWGSGEVAAPYLVQLSRKAEGLTAYLYLIPLRDVRDALAGNGLIGRGFRLGSLSVVLSLLLISPIPDLSSVLKRGAVVLIAFITLSVFYSPQWVLWLTPLLLPLAGKHRRLVPLIVALDLVTWGQWPIACNLAETFAIDDNPRDVILTLLAFARFAVLGLIVWNVLRTDRVGLAPREVIAVPAVA
jgi:hypothetical protein